MHRTTASRFALIPGICALFLSGCSMVESRADRSESQPPSSSGTPTTESLTGPAEQPAAAEPGPEPAPPPAPTVGGGTLEDPAAGPSPSLGNADDLDGFVLVKNWDFGTSGTIRDYDDLSEHFQYHDQFGTIANGTNYGAVIVAPTRETSLTGRKQPVEGADTGGRKAREFLDDSMKTYLIPLRGATECHPQKHNVGNGSFQAKWKLPRGGSRLGQDILWETRVRYRTPPYFWFAIWTCGNKWNKGAEIDVVESFGYDNGGGYTNFDGRYWHVGIVGGRKDIPYKNWGADMKRMGVESFDASEYHTWTMLYKADNTVAVYMDGILVQTGFTHWTLKTDPDGEELDMSFIFDAGWGHTRVNSVNKPLPASAFDNTFYEWDYSRVYLRPAR